MIKLILNNQSAMRHITMIFIYLLVVTGCKQEVAQPYDDMPRLYFYHEAGVQQDSIAVSFFATAETKLYDTVWLDIRTMGFPVDEDRLIGLEVLNEGDKGAAIPGIHYLEWENCLTMDYLHIPAGKVQASVPIVLRKDKSLETGAVLLKLRIRPNAYFQLGYEPWCSFTLSSTSLPVKPELWDKWWKIYFGVWGPKKMEFIILYVGFNEFGDYPEDYSICDYLRGKAKSKLQEYNNTHTEKWCEADGTPVEF